MKNNKNIEDILNEVPLNENDEATNIIGIIAKSQGVSPVLHRELMLPIVEDKMNEFEKIRNSNGIEINAPLSIAFVMSPNEPQSFFFKGNEQQAILDSVKKSYVVHNSKPIIENAIIAKQAQELFAELKKPLHNDPKVLQDFKKQIEKEKPNAKLSDKQVISWAEAYLESRAMQLVLHDMKGTPINDLESIERANKAISQSHKQTQTIKIGV